ncbi:MAG: hypothetical protein J6K89_04830 [Oscillospiraceae bacterium]|nr:hypothetical protein [Oscillospiraceae bacterium]
MEERIRYDALNLCSDHRFIRVLCTEGIFYDLVPKWRSRAHVFRLQQQYPIAEPVFRAHVPPCIFRDYTELNGPDIYREAIWRDGTQFFFPLTEKDQEILSAINSQQDQTEDSQ